MCVSINGPSNHDLWPFDLETGMRVASKVRNLPSKIGHARPLGSGIISYVWDGWTDRDRQTDGRIKAMLTAPFPAGGGITVNKSNNNVLTTYRISITQRGDRMYIMYYTVHNCGRNTTQPALGCLQLCQLGCVNMPRTCSQGLIQSVFHNRNTCCKPHRKQQ